MMRIYLMLLGSLASMSTVCRAVPAYAQVAYTVFPAVPPKSEPRTAQPGQVGAGVAVTVVVQDSTVDYAVHEIARQAHLRPVYDNSGPLATKRITARIVNATPMDAFAEVLKGTGFAAKLAPDGETVVIRMQQKASAHERAQVVAVGVIVGHVTDSASGAGLGGATVRVAGTKLSAISSDSGHFTLKDVPIGDQVLSVKLFGYRPAERTVTVVDSASTTVRIVIVSVPTVLSGVVTTATGVQRKVEVGNDITSLNVDSIMRVAPITSVTDLLETRVPGLTVLHTSGSPGDPSRIRIRGASSINGSNDPIVVVDGVRVYASQSDPRNDNLAPSVIGRVAGQQNPNSPNNGTPTTTGYAAPSPLDQIDPNSIETIEVFKGPSASALYGSDAANGVIVITTKHGRAGPAHWDFATGLGINTEPGSWPLNYYRFGYGASSTIGTYFCSWDDAGCVTDSIVGFQALNDPRYTVFANHGSDNTENLTISGGIPTLLYSITGSQAGDVGLLKLPEIETDRYEKFYGEAPPGWMQRPQNYTNWGVSGQLTAQPSPKVRVTLSSSLYDSNQQNSSLEGAVEQLEGIYIDPTLLGSNPLVQQFVERATAAQVTSTNALTGFWQPRSWLPITATGGINTEYRTDETLIPYGINSTASATGVEAAVDTTGSYGLGKGTSQVNTLNIGTSIPAFRNHVTIGLGGNLTSTSTADVTASTSELSPGVTEPSVFLPTASTFGQATSAGSTYGYFVEPRINISSRFFVSPGFRLDGGSATGAHATSTSGGLQGLTGFPKIDLSYVVVDQNNPKGILTLLRPRLAFGEAGTQPDPTDKLRLFNANGDTTVVTLNGQTYVPSVLLSTLGNTKLQPEISNELEGGFDAELWRGRFSVTWTQYDKTRHNAIISIPVAPEIVGLLVSSYQVNIGEIRNTGHEMTVNAQLLQSRAISWSVGGNISNDNNVVVRLVNGQQTMLLPDGTRVEAGYPLFSRFAQPIVEFADANHDGIIEGNEIRLGDSAVYVGQEDPKYQMNVNTGITLLNGRLSVNATFAYQNGLTQFNDGAATSGSFALLPNAPGTTLATQAAVAALSSTTIGVIQTVNTFRFSDLSINYNVPKSVSNLFRVPTMSVALQGKNLGLHSNYRGKDPNVDVFSTVSSGDETEDLGQIPEPRTWWLKIHLSN